MALLRKKNKQAKGTGTGTGIRTGTGRQRRRLHLPVLISGIAVVLLFLFNNVEKTANILSGSLNNNNIPCSNYYNDAPTAGKKFRSSSSSSLSSITATDTDTENRLLLAELTKNPELGSIVCPPLMTPIYDRVVPQEEVPQHQQPESNNNNTMTTNTKRRKIPKMIHVTYNSRCVPTEVFAKGIQRWKDELHDHSVYFHDDEAVDRLLDQPWHEFPELHQVLKCIHYKGAMKIDVWRMLVVYQFGGWYTDVDNIPAQEFQNNSTIDRDDTFFAGSDTLNRPNQNVFAMEPYHPIAVFTINAILKNLRALSSLRNPPVVFVTGPHAFKEGYEQYLTTATDRNEKLLLQPGVYKKGFMNKQIHKEPKWDWLNPVGNEMVEHNGVKMNKKERDGHISGVLHWKKVRDDLKTKKNPTGGGDDFSCREYLYRLNHPDPQENSITEKWSLNPNNPRVK